MAFSAGKANLKDYDHGTSGQNLVLSSAQAVTATAVSQFTYDLETGLLVTTASTFTNRRQRSSAMRRSSARTSASAVVSVRLRSKYSPAHHAGGGYFATGAVPGAPMNNTAFASGNVSDLVFTPYIMTGAIPLASILASSRIAVFDYPARQVKIGMPRFVNLNYVVVGPNFTGLTLTSYINTGGTSAQDTLGQYASNY